MAFSKMYWITDNSTFKTKVKVSIRNAAKTPFDVRVRVSIRNAPSSSLSQTSGTEIRQ